MSASELATPVRTDPPGTTAEGAGTEDRLPWLLGFLCVLITALPSYVLLPGPLKSNGSPARMIAVVLLGLVMLGFVLVRRTVKVRQVRPGVLILLIYFLLWLTTFGVALADFTPLPSSSATEASMTRSLIALTANIGLGLYVVMRVRTPRQRDFVLGCLLCGMTFACLVGLLQSVAAIDLRFLFQPPGFVVNTDTLSLVERAGVERALGTSEHAIEYSILTAATVPLALYFARYARVRNIRILSAAICGLAILTVPTGVSRTGVIAFAGALLLLMFAHTVRQIATGLVVGALALGGYIAAFPKVANALWQTIITSEKDPSVLSRTADYATVSETFRAHPVFGLGLGASPPEIYGWLDNEWLQAIVQGGLFGVAAMIVLAGGGVFGIAAALRRASNQRERYQGYVLGAILVAILISSFTFDLFGFQQATFLFFITFGLLWSGFTIDSPDPRPQAWRARRGPKAVATSDGRTA
ncbi:O-antigen ligase family protein [Mycolicibacterium diernhoferi]|uniref:O-antigen ligase family protein n=1 Tax=Mycolicibacterium diernhoferi TaxID=1801 RepID=UPI001F1C8E30|nr:O-antigen ligase family protein [Mycolicibacterium diernhoferi]